MVASLVLACAVTLASATIVLLVPLENRLSSGELAYLRTSTRHAADAFQTELGDHDVNRRFNEYQRLARQIARLARARVILADTNGRRLADTDRDVGIPLALVQEASDTQRLASDVSGTRPRIARVAVPVRGTKLVTVLEEPLRIAGAANTVRSGLVIAIAIALVTAIALGLVIGRSLSRRVRRLRDGALRVAEHGIEEDLPVDDVPDEIGDLAGAFAHMQEQLRREEEARMAFVGTASHELRTPLTTLNGNLELLEQELHASAPDLDAARDGVVRARAQAQRLSGLATDLLELSRLDTGIPATLLPTDLPGTARAVLSEFGARAERMQVSLELEMRGQQRVVQADSQGIARIVRILVDNGLRFAPPGSALRVSVDTTGADACVSVSDDGIGVPADERDLIFERFRRGRTTGGQSGFGLGLAIGRELAQRMGGKLRLVEGREQGAEFELCLPMRAEQGGWQSPSSSPTPPSRAQDEAVPATPS